MKIEKYKVVSLSYTLKSGDEVIEVVDNTQPMTFVFGSGFLLPKFEQNIEDKKVGDKFDFELSCEDAYGEVVADAIVELEKSMFKEEDGSINETLFTIGTVIPLRDGDGNRFDGRVTEVKDSSLLVDLNHPMAGKNLHFVGEVLEVREPNPDELARIMGGGGCGCGCGEGDCNNEDCGDGGCGDGHKHGGCGCGC